MVHSKLYCCESIWKQVEDVMENIQQKLSTKKWEEIREHSEKEGEV